MNAKTENQQNPQKKLFLILIILFLILMLVLTFFSNTIRNLTLPRVNTLTVSGNRLSDSYFVSGTLNADEKGAVRAPMSGEVRTSLKESGSVVKRGEPLMQVTYDTETELAGDQNALLELKIAHASELAGRIRYDEEAAALELEELDHEMNGLKANLAAAASVGRDTSGLNEQIYQLDLKRRKMVLSQKREKERAEEMLSAYRLQDEQYETRVRELEERIRAMEQLLGDGTITAPCDGVVRMITGSDGASFSAGDLLATVYDPEAGYEVKVVVTADQAKIAESASKFTIPEYSRVPVSLQRITDAVGEEGDERCLYFHVEADSYLPDPGEKVTIQVSSKEEYYSAVIPSAAVRVDSEGTFAFVLKGKKSPLGNRYYAEKKRITVLKTNDELTAVSGLEEGVVLIRGYNRPISEGDRVSIF